MDMTKLTTSAKFAKENFYLNYYNQWEMPLYLLTPENDEFIRKSYSMRLPRRFSRRKAAR